MIEPMTLLTGFITVWAQLNNYGIDSEKYPHLKDIRVRRENDNQLYAHQNKVHNTKTDLKDSVIMKNIYRGVELNRVKRNNANNNGNDYVEHIIPLASYPPNSHYYSQNTAGVPYYYNAYKGNNRAYNGNNNGYNTTGRIVRTFKNGTSFGQNYNRYPHERSGAYVMPSSGFNSNNNRTGNNGYNNNGNFLNTRSNSSQIYPFNNNRNNSITVNGYNNNGNNNNGNIPNARSNSSQIYPFNNNGNNSITVNGYNNNGNNNTHNKNNSVTIKPAYFMASVGCPKFMQSVTIFGTKMCVAENDDYDK